MSIHLHGGGELKGGIKSSINSFCLFLHSSKGLKLFCHLGKKEIKFKVWKVKEKLEVWKERDKVRSLERKGKIEVWNNDKGNKGKYLEVRKEKEILKVLERKEIFF